MKKLAILSVFSLAFVFSTSAASAFFTWPHSHSGLVINNDNIARTFNDATSGTNTGGNKVIKSMGFLGGASISSGNAEAQSLSDVNANSNSIDAVIPTANSNSIDAVIPTAGKATVNNTNRAFTRNEAAANANTGENIIVHNLGGATIGTGSAFAGSSAMTIVNSNMISVAH